MNLFKYIIKLLKEEMPLEDIKGDYWKKRYKDVDDADDQLARLLYLNNDFNQGDTLLDIGCGNGALLNFFIQKKLKVKGIDICPFILQKCKNMGFTIENKDLSKDSVLEEEFDYIVIASVLEHIRDAERIIHKAKNKFRKKLYISVPNFGFLPYRLRVLFGKFPITSVWKHINEHIRFWTFHDFCYWTRKQGLEVENYFGVDDNWFARKFPKYLSSNILYIINQKI